MKNMSTSSDGSFSLRSHPHQTLKEHLEGVTQIALQIYDSNNTNQSLREIVRKICMAHDFAKSTSFFQDYLNYHELKEKTDFEKTDKRIFGNEKNHALLSAFFAYWWLPIEYKFIGFLIVKRHHGSVIDARDEVNLQNDYFNLKKQVDDIKNNHRNEVEKIYGFDLNDFFDFINEKNIRLLRKHFRDLDDVDISKIMEFNYLYSLLLTADKLQLIKEIPNISDQKPAFYVENYKNDLRDEILKKNPLLVGSEIFKMRDMMFRDVKKELENTDLKKESFFSINVPTGAGKTFLAYYSALYIAEKIKNDFHHDSRIIYALPYMSIIDQNYAELEKIISYNENGVNNLKSTEILKHHSFSEIKYESEDVVYKNYDARFCFENWQSRMITTTFVQLFNTIFKIGKNSTSHRFHTLKNSVIILDEVQIIEEKYFPIIKSFMATLANDYGVKFILVTATMPILIETHELIPNKKYYFQNLNRIKIYNNTHEEVTIDDFKNIVLNDISKNDDKSFLIVLNTIKSAKDVFLYLREKTHRKCIYLSTEIYPKARLEKIDFIKNASEKTIVISTQLIEAGVDIDMDIIYRDFSPLDSINQTSGRANRNGGNEIGLVKIYRLTDGPNGAYFHSYIYPTFLTEITRMILEDKYEISENEIFDLNESYSKEVIKKASFDISDDIFNYMKKLDLKKMRDSFELINSDYRFKEDIFIAADDEFNRIINELISVKKQIKKNGNSIERNTAIKNLVRILNQYKISLNKTTYDSIKDSLYEIEDFDLKYLPLKVGSLPVYSEEEGIISNNQSIEIF